MLFAARDIIAPLFVLKANHTSRSQNDQSAGNATPDELRLLLAWPAPMRVFAENLADRIRGRVVPEMETTSAPDNTFWHDIDLETPFPRRGLRDSVAAHAALLGLLYAISIWPNTTVHLADSRTYRTLSGYNISEYLPELHSAPTHQSAAGKADPVLARQEIRSLPDAPDNLRQTIVTPTDMKLQHDIALPNLVAYAPVPAAPAMEAASQKPKLQLPAMLPQVVAPAAETGSLHSRSRLPSMMPQVVEPTPEVAQVNPRLALPAFQPNVVQPAPELGSVSRGTSTNLARMLPSGSDPVPPAPQVGEAHRGSGQLLALSLHPSELRAPVVVPEGNRRGAFAASPEGHADAKGTPGAEASGGSGSPNDSNGKANAPAGISVGAAPNTPSAIAGPSAPGTRPGAADAGVHPDVRSKLMAAMHAPSPSIPPRPALRESTAARSEVENRIFAGRRSYTLSVNMPNLNAATGSWIIHFVERVPSLPQSPIAAPEVVSKSDPAYPGELMKDGVQGTVVLTAIIRADGSVSDIAVAKSLNPRLDQNAVQALSHWLFRPALKNGQAIDLEAVITVPFQRKASAF